MEITPKLSVTEDKIRLLTVKTDMFKTACLTLNVLVPMGEYAAEYAVLSSYLVHSSKKYDSLIKLNSRLEELYGALLSGSISRHGENYRIQLSITCIDDSLTFDGKSVTGASLELLLSLLTKPSADENGFSGYFRNFIHSKLIAYAASPIRTTYDWLSWANFRQDGCDV